MTGLKTTIITADKELGTHFSTGLLHWNKEENRRQMPWKGEKDPYKIWLSEIILQQTRVEQGLKYYERFIAALPTIQHLAAAPEQEVFKLWEGLGYYSRCRNLIATAKEIIQNKNGIFPKDYNEVLALKGIGPYTAAAITSFAYNAPYAVLDGNVFRVLSRIFGIAAPIDSTEGKKAFTALAQDILPQKKAGAYNQAIMDFGATLCKPVPECIRCFFASRCKAFLQNKQALLPVKEKRTAVRERWFHYFVLECNGAVALHQRTGKDVWQDLYEPLLVEGEKVLSKQELLQHLQQSFGLKKEDYQIVSAAATTTQKLSHQLIHFLFIHLELKNNLSLPHHQWILKKDLFQYPFPKTVQEFLVKNALE